MKAKLMLSGSLVALWVAAAHAAPVHFEGTGHYYEGVYVGGDGIDWTDARNAAESAGGYLATVHSEGENDFIFELSLSAGLWMHSNQYGPWLGGYQTAGSEEPGGGWVWVTAEPWTYDNWRSGEPNNSLLWQGLPENVLHLISDHNTSTPSPLWNDMPDLYLKRGYIVEYIPEPATLSLLAVASLALGRKGRRYLVKGSKG